MTNLSVAFIKAQWHAEIVDRAQEGFDAGIAESGRAATVAPFEVAGAFEMLLLAKRLAQSRRFDAVVAAALVVDGGIYRHDFVAQAVVSGLMQAQLETDVPVFWVSLTPHDFQDTTEHRNLYNAHFVKKGGEAAAALAVADLKI